MERAVISSVSFTPTPTSTHPDQDLSGIRVACILRKKCLGLLWAGMAVRTCASYWPNPLQTLAAVPVTQAPLQDIQLIIGT